MENLDNFFKATKNSLQKNKKLINNFERKLKNKDQNSRRVAINSLDNQRKKICQF